MQNEQITSLTELLKYTEGFSDFCYRGQINANWGLVPSIYRELDGMPNDEIIEMFEVAGQIERDVYREFEMKARQYSQDTGINFENIWERMCLAQHYGTPTRLLDWTSDLRTAAYFAVMGADDTDAAIWCLDLSKLPPPPHPSKLGRRNPGHGYRLRVLPKRHLSFGQVISDAYNPGQTPRTKLTGDNSFFTVIHPPDIDDRIKNQAGLFSVYVSFGADDPHHFVWSHSNYLQEIEAQRGETILHKLTIPKDKRAKFRHELERLGANPSQIFPDLIGLGMYLSASKREQFESNKEQFKNITSLGGKTP